MGITSLVLFLIVHIIRLLPLFIALIFVFILISQIATSYLQRLAGNQFAWPPDSPFLGHSRVPVKQPMLSLRDIGLAISRYTRELGHVECIFCLYDINEGDEFRELTCKHLFHRSCLDRWLEFGQATCPLCRDYLLPSETKAKLAEIAGDIDESAVPLMAAFVRNGWWG